jgi:hypothetical protein
VRLVGFSDPRSALSLRVGGVPTVALFQNLNNVVDVGAAALARLQLFRQVAGSAVLFRWSCVCRFLLHLSTLVGRTVGFSDALPGLILRGSNELIHCRKRLGYLFYNYKVNHCEILTPSFGIQVLSYYIY